MRKTVADLLKELGTRSEDLDKDLRLALRELIIWRVNIGSSVEREVVRKWAERDEENDTCALARTTTPKRS